MCELLQIIRILGFAACITSNVASLFYLRHYCRMHNINMNSVSGQIKIHYKILKFQDKKFSIIMLATAYGGAAILAGVVILTA